MSETLSEANKQIDPFEQWRNMRDSYMEIWAKAMGVAVNSEAYSKASGAMLESFLMVAPFREAQKKMMLSALEQLNMPSRVEFISLAERLSNLEVLLDDMDNKLTKLLHLATENVARAGHPEAVKVADSEPELRSIPVSPASNAKRQGKKGRKH